MLVLGIFCIVWWILCDIGKDRKADEIRKMRENGWNGQSYQKIKTKNGTYAIWKNDKK